MILLLNKKKMSGKVLITVSVVLFVFAYIYGHFLSSLDFLPIKVFRAIFGPTGRQFTAPLYLMIGFLLSRRRFSALTGVVLTALGLALSPLFSSAGGGYYSEPILILVASGVFIIALSINFKNSKLFSFFRTSSTVMYFSHLLIYVLISLTFLGELRDGLVIYLIVTTICLMISVPVFFMEQRKNSVVKFLLSGHWNK